MVIARAWHKPFLIAIFVGFLVLFACQRAPQLDNDVLLRGNSGEPGTLDPHLALSSPERIIINDLFVGLFTQDAQGKIIPGAAQSYSVSPDGKTWTFKLRSGLKWSDGVAMTSEDFLYSLRRALSPDTGSPTASLLFPIENAEAVLSGDLQVTELGVSAPDENTLQIRLNRTTPYFDKLLLSPAALPVPRHVIEADGEQWSRPPRAVSNGAFKLDDWKPRVHVEISRNALFFDAQSVQLEKVRFIPTEDLGAQLRRFRAGEIHLGLNFPPSQADWVKENLAESVRIFPILGTYYYPFNLSSPKLQDVRTRQALSIAIDREVLANQLLTSGEIPAYHLVASGFAHYGDREKPAYASQSIEDRRAQAIELLAEAGFSSDNPLELEIRYNMTEEHQAVAVAIASMWEAIGVRTQLLSTETRTHFRDLKLGEYEVARTAVFPAYDDPMAVLAILDARSSDNYSGYANREFDASIASANAIEDPVARAQALIAAENLALSEYPVIPIYHYVSKRLVSPRVMGWQDNSIGTHLSRYLWLEDQYE